jgi:hypothetical protein
VIDDVTGECLAAIADTSFSGRRVARELTTNAFAQGLKGLGDGFVGCRIYLDQQKVGVASSAADRPVAAGQRGRQRGASASGPRERRRLAEKPIHA